uniref:Tektin n=2 Tax=Fundulus heteroclitus TaxID=8078 RepID=A0A3Q2PML4_FUNHE
MRCPSDLLIPDPLHPRHYQGEYQHLHLCYLQLCLLSLPTRFFHLSGSRMSALSLKPSLRHSVSDWSSNNQQLSATAQHQRHVSHEVRQEGRALRNDTHCKTVWDESATSRRLGDRIWDVARWRDVLESCAQKVDEEMEALTLSKEQSEQALAATSVPLEVTNECLTLREGRRGYELVGDAVEEQLKKEVELIEGVQQRLQQGVHQAFEQLCVLQEARHQLTADLQNKMEALDIDMSCLSLTTTSPNISLKTNPTRIPSGSSTPQEWVQFSQRNVARAHEAVHVSQQMREELSLSRAQLHNELEAQLRATEFALRKRTHQEQRARDELQWQMKNTQDEMAEMESDIRGLDADLQAKTASLKLAHTRLEARTQRCGVDLCRDQVQHGLVAEVQQLEATIQDLKQKLSEAQHSLQKLKLHQSRMQQDLSRKQEALTLEQRSIHTRTRIASPSWSDRTAPPLVPLMNSSGRSDLQLLARSLTY